LKLCALRLQCVKKYKVLRIIMYKSPYETRLIYKLGCEVYSLLVTYGERKIIELRT
jgi:hypothetical protein